MAKFDCGRILRSREQIRRRKSERWLVHWMVEWRDFERTTAFRLWTSAGFLRQIPL